MVVNLHYFTQEKFLKDQLNEIISYAVNFVNFYNPFSPLYIILTFNIKTAMRCFRVG